MSNRHDSYQEILVNGPSPGTLLIVLSEMREAGQHQRVIQECVKAIAAHPNDFQLRRLLAETYFEMGLFAYAETEVEKLIAQMRDLASLYKLQAMIYYRESRFQEATKSLKLYLTHRPDDQDAVHLYESLPVPADAAETSHTPADAAEISSGAEAPGEPVEFLVEMEPEESREMGEETEAVEREDFPDIATPTLAEVYVNQGQLAEAVDIYERILSDNPEDHASKQRVMELKAMLTPPPPPERSPGERTRERKGKMIATLNTWLEEMRGTNQ